MLHQIDTSLKITVFFTCNTDQRQGLNNFSELSPKSNCLFDFYQICKEKLIYL